MPVGPLTPPTYEQLTVRVPPEVARGIEALAREHERTPAQEMRLALRRHVEAEQEASAA